MIEEIAIRDLGVIGRATLPLGPGFTAVTGETGAGKTMVVTALGLLLGQRAESGIVRSGSAQAVVDGRWVVPEEGSVVSRVRDAGGDVDDGELFLSRVVSAEGRSRAVVGGRTAPIGVLGDLADHLVVVHGQSEQIRLKSAQAQRAAVDAHGGAALAEAATSYRSAYDAWQAARAELDEITRDREARRAEAESLREAIDEIEAVSPVAGELDELDATAERLSNSEDLRLAAGLAHEILSTDAVDGTRDVLSLVEEARRQVERVAPHDAALQPIADLLAEVSVQVSESSSRLSSYLGSLDADAAGDLEVVQTRRAEIGSLLRKHGPTVDDALRLLDEGSRRLVELDSDDDRLAQLDDEVEQFRAEAEARASVLTDLRRASGADLSSRVSAELRALAMAGAEIVVEVSPRGELGASGADAVALLLRPHPGSEPRPLGKGASGGELSRVMLALEVVMAGSSEVPTFVFDEVDAGVGGAAAIEIGRRLAALAERAQVIVVTHLAQVAAFATNHLRVVKDASGEVTASSVQQLDGDERVAEMARLLSGLPDSASGLDHARELLQLASAGADRRP
ncbi:DNA repair protein RecN (Recombination protein N) [Frigoribacterium sp. PvP120]|uniref:DNA repair protein RecN n=1 Tax=unclassified Frigoribacterium TaxID=2627005 RepID=UPI001AEB72B7|nr:DNA repair protein RecN [Frigoribacterium sp. PvP121]MBP1242167.1 DNA repair protein RecN (Recombination protein N) [Frigoribacterium sp. PvP121]